MPDVILGHLLDPDQLRKQHPKTLIILGREGPFRSTLQNHSFHLSFSSFRKEMFLMGLFPLTYRLCPSSCFSFIFYCFLIYIDLSLLCYLFFVPVFVYRFTCGMYMCDLCSERMKNLKQFFSLPISPLPLSCLVLEHHPSIHLPHQDFFHVQCHLFFWLNLFSSIIYNCQFFLDPFHYLLIFFL